MRVDAFFEGGGILGISFIGAYKALYERGFFIDKVAGISAGSIISSLIVAGYTPNELIELLIEHSNFQFFKQKTNYSEKSYIGKPLSLLFNKGIYDSEAIENWLNPLLLKKGINTFKDLIIQNESQLKVLTTDFTEKRLMVIPDDLPYYSLSKENFKVALAVRMSCAIPLFYTPVPLETKYRTNYMIDGGVIRNIPTTIINKDGELHKLTLRFKIKDVNNKWLNHILDLKNTYVIDHKNQPLEKTIIIPNRLKIKATDFDISKEDIIELYKQGYKATVHFIRNELVQFITNQNEKMLE